MLWHSQFLILTRRQLGLQQVEQLNPGSLLLEPKLKRVLSLERYRS